MHHDGTASNRLASVSARLLCALAAMACYGVTFFVLYFGSPLGAGATNLSGVAVGVVGSLLGRWLGLVVGLCSLPLNLALLGAVGVPVTDAVELMGNGAGCATNMAIGWAAGWMGELYRRVRVQARELARDRETLMREVAERKRAEDRLRESEELFRLITENADDMSSLWDPEGKLVYCSPAYARTIGREPPATLHVALADLFRPDDSDARRTLNRAKAGQHELLTLRVRDVDGARRWIEASGSLVPMRGDSYVMVVARDITARHEAQAELERSHEQYQALVDSIEGVVWECSLPRLKFTYVSPYVEKLLGYSPQCLLDDPNFWHAHLHPEDRDEAVRQFRAATAELCDHELVYRFVAADGRIVWLHDRIRMVVKNGKPVKLRGVVVDITAQKQVEAALREGQALIRRVLESVPAGIMMVSPDARIVEANAHAMRYLGLSYDQLDQLYVNACEHRTIWEDGSECPVDEYPVIKCLRTGLPQPAVPIGVRYPDGEVFWGMFSATPAATDPRTGKPAGAVVTFLDISERRQLEQQLRQAQKMDAVGRLAGGVAHDFNNLLTVINGYCELLLDNLVAGTPGHGLASEIAKAGGRAAALTRQLLAFGRKEVVALQTLDVNAVLTGMQELLKRMLGEDVDVAMRLGFGVLPVKADAAQLEQVILNLVVNALDAMPEGGRFTLSTAEVGISETGALPLAEAHAGVYILLEVSDNGVGMTEAVRSRLFEPFFTTKAVGKGTGLGLATVYGIVKQFGGHIEVQTAPGQGTTFRVFLPRSTTPVDAVEPSASPVPARGAGEVVLLVEDEPLVRNLVARCLRMAGYEVLEAPTSPEAGLLCERHEGPIHLLLTDVVMPQLSGPALARLAQERRTDLKVLFMSGHTDDAILRRGIREQGVPFLQKPFTPDALARKVREVLDG